jgi:HAD superfamily hydrolase (TIGR02253 family)
MKKKAVLFDLDNTLYDYDVVHNKALRATFKEFKKYFSITYNKFIDLYNISKREINRELSGTASSHSRVLYFQRLIEKTHKTVNPGIILKLYDAYWDTAISTMKLRRNVLPVLKKLKEKKLQIGIVTDLTTHIQLRKLQKLGLSEFIDVLMTSEEAGREKPHPSMFLFTLNKLNVMPEDTIFIGDNPKADMEGANAVGIETVLLVKGKYDKKSIHDYRKPMHVIKEISEILKIL